MACGGDLTLKSHPCSIVPLYNQTTSLHAGKMHCYVAGIIIPRRPSGWWGHAGGRTARRTTTCSQQDPNKINKKTWSAAQDDRQVSQQGPRLRKSGTPFPN